MPIAAGLMISGKISVYDTSISLNTPTPDINVSCINNITVDGSVETINTMLSDPTEGTVVIKNTGGYIYGYATVDGYSLYSAAITVPSEDTLVAEYLPVINKYKGSKSTQNFIRTGFTSTINIDSFANEGLFCVNGGLEINGTVVGYVPDIGPHPVADGTIYIRCWLNNENYILLDNTIDVFPRPPVNEYIGDFYGEIPPNTLPLGSYYVQLVYSGSACLLPTSTNLGYYGVPITCAEGPILTVLNYIPSIEVDAEPEPIITPLTEMEIGLNYSTIAPILQAYYPNKYYSKLDTINIKARYIFNNNILTIGTISNSLANVNIMIPGPNPTGIYEIWAEYVSSDDCFLSCQSPITRVTVVEPP